MSPLFAYWVHDLDPFLVKFTENIGIRYYGLAYLLGFVTAAWLLHCYARRGRSLVPADRIADFMVAVVFGVLLGGRLGYFLLYQPGTLVAHPLVFFRVWDGGMASHGGFVGVALALWWFARKEKVPMWHLGDIIATVTPAGLLFGRIANFINGELVGKATTVSWAVIFPHNEVDRALGQLAVPRHPSQLYQAALEGALLLAYMQWRFWRRDATRTQPGRLTGEFLIAYAIVRMIGELFREPDASLILGVSRGTFYSVFLIVAGAILIVRARRATSLTK